MDMVVPKKMVSNDSNLHPKMRLLSFQEFTRTKYPKYLCSPLFYHYRTGSYPPTSKVLENPWFLNSASSATGAPGNTASSRSSSMRDLSALCQRGEAELAGCDVFFITSILSYRFHCISWNIVEYHEISSNINKSCQLLDWIWPANRRVFLPFLGAYCSLLRSPCWLVWR